MGKSIEIKQILENRNINNLYHFTKGENLKSILKYGLMSVNNLNDDNISFKCTDEDRNDKKLNYISSSISFPNYKYFFPTRCNSTNKLGWVVLEIDSNILCDKECIYCCENAATNNVTYIKDTEKKGSDALEKLFDDFDEIKRVDLKIDKNMPTNPQAEVLIPNKIDLKYIKGIYFENLTVKKYFFDELDSDIIISDNKIKIDVKSELFKYRNDYTHW